MSAELVNRKRSPGLLARRPNSIGRFLGSKSAHSRAQSQERSPGVRLLPWIQSCLLMNKHFGVRAPGVTHNNLGGTDSTPIVTFHPHVRPRETNGARWNASLARRSNSPWLNFFEFYTKLMARSV